MKKFYQSTGYCLFTVLAFFSFNQAFPQSQISNFRYAKDSFYLNFREVAKTDSVLFFTRFEPETGQELWVTDGTSKNTFLLKDFTPGDRTNSGFRVEFAQDRAYISTNNELYMFSLKDFQPLDEPLIAFSDQYIQDACVIKDELYVITSKTSDSKSIYKISRSSDVTLFEDDLAYVFGHRDELVYGKKNEHGGNDAFWLGDTLLPILKNTPLVLNYSPFLEVEGHSFLIYEFENSSKIFVIENGVLIDSSTVSGRRNLLIPAVIEQQDGTINFLLATKRNTDDYDLTLTAFENGQFKEEGIIEVKDQIVFQNDYRYFVSKAYPVDSGKRYIFFSGFDLWPGRLYLRYNEIDFEKFEVNTIRLLEDHAFGELSLGFNPIRLNETEFELRSGSANYRYNISTGQLTDLGLSSQTPEPDTTVISLEKYNLYVTAGMYSDATGDTLSILDSDALRLPRSNSSLLYESDGDIVVYLSNNEGDSVARFYKFEEDRVTDSLIINTSFFSPNGTKAGEDIYAARDNSLIRISLKDFAVDSLYSFKDKDWFSVYQVLSGSSVRLINTSEGLFFESDKVGLVPLKEKKADDYQFVPFQGELLVRVYQKGLYLLTEYGLEELYAGNIGLVSEGTYSLLFNRYDDEQEINEYFILDEALTLHIFKGSHSYYNYPLKLVFVTNDEGDLEVYDPITGELLRVVLKEEPNLIACRTKDGLIAKNQRDRSFSFLRFKDEGYKNLKLDYDAYNLTASEEGFFYSRRIEGKYNRWFYDIIKNREIKIFESSQNSWTVSDDFVANACVLTEQDSLRYRYFHWSLKNSTLNEIMPNVIWRISQSSLTAEADFEIIDSNFDRYLFEYSADSATLLYSLPSESYGTLFSQEVKSGFWFHIVPVYSTATGLELFIVNKARNELLGEIVEGPASPNFGNGIRLGDDFYVMAYTYTQGNQLWKFSNVFEDSQLNLLVPLSITNSGEEGVLVFPNPFENFLKVTGVFDTYQIFTSDGRLVDSGTLFSNEISVKSLRSGLYILRLNGPNGLVTKKVVRK